MAVLDRDRPSVVAVLVDDGTAGGPPARPGAPILGAAALGLHPDDPRLVAIAAAVAGCPPRGVLVVSEPDHPLAELADVAAGHLAVEPGSAVGGRRLLAEVLAWEEATQGAVGVGPHPRPWPDDDRLDPDLLAGGDRRNVVDRFRYWREDAIVAELDRHRRPVHVAVENWRHDLNIGTVVRNANAFNVAGVHVVGRRRWNRRGAMATDRYLPVHHHPSVADLVAWAEPRGLALVGIDNVPGARPLEGADLPSPAVLLFGQEGPGLSDAALDACTVVCAIAQAGSTRSLNAGVASGIALWAWARQHVAWPDDGARA